MHIRICEVGPRDGLQNHSKDVSTPNKITMVNTLSQCGFYSMEVTSFVSPKWVPKMADATAVITGIDRMPEVDYIVLTPNERGIQNALPHAPDTINIFPAASEEFCQKNLNTTKDETFARFATVAKIAHKNNITIKGSLSCAGYCPYAGDISPQTIADDIKKLQDMGCQEISLADTVGHITGDKSRRVLDAVLKITKPEILSGHFHDTMGYALDNVEAYMGYNITLFDSAILGLGGCPFAKGAKGNLNTRKLVEYLHKNGHTTNIDMEALTQAENTIQPFV